MRKLILILAAMFILATASSLGLVEYFNENFEAYEANNYTWQTGATNWSCTAATNSNCRGSPVGSPNGNASQVIISDPATGNKYLRVSAEGIDAASDRYFVSILGNTSFPSSTIANNYSIQIDMRYVGADSGCFANAVTERNCRGGIFLQSAFESTLRASYNYNGLFFGDTASGTYSELHTEGSTLNFDALQINNSCDMSDGNWHTVTYLSQYDGVGNYNYREVYIDDVLCENYTTNFAEVSSSTGKYIEFRAEGGITFDVDNVKMYTNYTTPTNYSNSLPTNTSASIDPSPTMEVNDVFTGYCYAEDKDDAQFSYYYTVFQNDTIYETGNLIGVSNATNQSVKAYFGGIFNFGDSLVFSCTPFDEVGNGTTANSTKVYVISGTRPNMTAAYAQDEINYTDQIDAVCYAEDQEDATFGYFLNTYRNGTFVNDYDLSTGWNNATNESVFSFSSSFLPDETWIIECIPYDAAGNGTAANSSNISIIGRPTIGQPIILGNNPVNVGETLTCGLNALTYTAVDNSTFATATKAYRWIEDGNTISGETSSSLTVSNQTWLNITCEGKVLDSNNVSSIFYTSSNSIELANTPPTIANVTVSPSSPTSNQNIVCEWDYSDVNGDSQDDTLVQWYKNGEFLRNDTDDNGDETLESSQTVSGDVIYCIVTGNDGKNFSTSSVQSNNATVQQSAPTMSGISLIPTAPTAASNLQCDATATDADNDNLTFFYRFLDTNSSVLQAYSTTNLYSCSGDLLCTGGDNITCEAYAFDGTLNSTTLTASRTITSSLPVAQDVRILPLQSNISSDLNCDYTYYDADGDTESGTTFRWFVNGSLSAVTTQVLAAGNTSDDDRWICEVTPKNAGQTGTSVNSSTRLISTTKPYIISTDTNGTVALGNDIEFSWTWYDPNLPSGDYNHYICTTSAITSSGCSAGTLCSVNSSNTSLTCDYTPGVTTPRSNTAYIAIFDDNGFQSTVEEIDWTFDTLPTSNTPTLNVTSNGVTNTFTCNVTGITDVDGDSVQTTYAFKDSNDNVLQTYTTIPTYVTSTGDGVNGDNIKCVVRLDDGFATFDQTVTNHLRVSTLTFDSSVEVDNDITITAGISNTSSISTVNLTFRNPYFTVFEGISMTGNGTDKSYTFSPNIIGVWRIQEIFVTQTDGQSYLYKTAQEFSVTAEREEDAGAPGGGGGGGGPGPATIVNITAEFCGDGICQDNENPSSCWRDCRVDIDSLFTCIFDEDIQCNWEQNWFPAALLVFLVIVGAVSIYISEQRKGGKRK